MCSVDTGVEAPCVLIAIPDGHTKALPTSGSKVKRLKDVASSEPVSSTKGSSKVRTAVIH